MTKILLKGTVAGAATAALVALPLSAHAMSALPLFYLAPLPIMTAALGWSHRTGLASAAAAAVMLGIAFGGAFSLFFLVVIGVPAWWLGYLAMLGRPVANGGPAAMEWYPPGRLVLWAAGLGAAVTAAGALAMFWGQEDAVRSGIKSAVEAVLRHDPEAQAIPPGLGGTDIDAMVDTILQLVPPAAAMIAAIVYALNLWLAGLAVRLWSGLQRPWPNLPALSFPAWTAALYGGSLAGTFAPGIAGVAASLVAAPLTAAFTMVGFAVVHAVTRGMNGRGAILWGFYLCAIFLVTPVLVMTILGVTETLFDLRTRFARRSPPARPET